MYVHRVVSNVRYLRSHRRKLHARLKAFHAKHNHKVHWHLLAHSGLCAMEMLRCNPIGVVNQGWLTLAVVPVHIIRFFPTSQLHTFQ